MPDRACKPGNKKSARLVRGCDGKMRCIRFGDRNMSIKKHKPGRKKSFCARHKCSEKGDPATPGYQSCKAWDCPGMSKKCGRRATKRVTKKPTRTKRPIRATLRKSKQTKTTLRGARRSAKAKPRSNRNTRVVRR